MESVRVELLVIQHFDQHERGEPEPQREPMVFELSALQVDGRRWILSKEDHLGMAVGRRRDRAREKERCWKDDLGLQCLLGPCPSNRAMLCHLVHLRSRDAPGSFAARKSRPLILLSVVPSYSPLFPPLSTLS